MLRGFTSLHRGKRKKKAMRQFASSAQTVRNVAIIADILMVRAEGSRSCLMTVATGTGAADFHCCSILPNVVAW
jgi:hypothetical protein